MTIVTLALLSASVFAPVAQASATRSSSDTDACDATLVLGSLCSVTVSHLVEIETDRFNDYLDYVCDPWGAYGNYSQCSIWHECHLEAEGVNVVGILTCGSESVQCDDETACSTWDAEWVTLAVNTCHTFTASGWVVSLTGTAQATPSSIRACVGPYGPYFP